jgi:hypothetical protein
MITAETPRRRVKRAMVHSALSAPSAAQREREAVSQVITPFSTLASQPGFSEVFYSPRLGVSAVIKRSRRQD